MQDLQTQLADALGKSKLVQMISAQAAENAAALAAVEKRVERRLADVSAAVQSVAAAISNAQHGHTTRLVAQAQQLQALLDERDAELQAMVDPAATWAVRRCVTAECAVWSGVVEDFC
jgi:hypothetical protein